MPATRGRQRGRHLPRLPHPVFWRRHTHCRFTRRFRPASPLQPLRLFHPRHLLLKLVISYIFRLRDFSLFSLFALLAVLACFACWASLQLLKLLWTHSSQSFQIRFRRLLLLCLQLPLHTNLLTAALSSIRVAVARLQKQLAGHQVVN